MYTNIWDTRVHGIPQTRSTLSIAEQGCRAEDTVQARNEVVFNLSIPKNSIQAYDGRHSKFGAACFSNATNRRLSIIVIEFNGYRSKINHRYHR